ncbi:hypothetical protein INT46_004971 [Mucor plumbeus]|uniref:Kinetochore protein Nuf2 N-terminal domain-containing protein n=1 Tax=Mucor plumbeus TaxID=97098 RepID=A0A8H7V8H2_9FUNG|nr:hypothetical protein INT46_004971 [Mucor plumbeus]
MQASRGNSKIPTARQSKATSNERLKRPSILPSASSIPEGPDYLVRQADVPQMLRFLKDLGIHAHEEDLTHPNPIRIRQLFEILINFLVPHRMEFLYIEREKVKLEFADSPDLGIEIAEVVPVFREMQYLLKQLKFTDIKVTDILSPSPPRLMKILSALMNFSLFRDSVYEHFEPLAKEVEQLTLQCDNLSAEKAALDKEINEIETQTELERVEVQEWENKNQELEEVMRQMRRDSDAILADLEFHKNERRQMKDTLQELQYTILAAIEHVKQLKQYDTWDVEEMKVKIEELEVVINSNTEEVNTLEKDIPKLEEIISETKSLNNNLTKWIQTIESVNNLHGDVNRHKKTNEAIKKELNSLTLMQKEFATKITTISRSLALQDSRLQFLMEQREKKRETVDQYLKDWDKKNVIINKEVESAMNERKKCEAQIKELQEKCNEGYAEQRLYIESLRSQITKLFFIINDQYTNSLKYAKPN